MKFERSISILQPFFSLFCLEDNDVNHVKAFVKDGKVKTNKEMCGRKIIRMAYNHDDGYFEVDKGGNVVKTKAISSEVLISFFPSQNLTPVWENANNTWGWFDEETGRWTGAIALVSHVSSYVYSNYP